MSFIKWEDVKKKAGIFDEPAWGPTGKDVYERTYSRTKPDGTRESWRETVERVVDGNLGLVDERFIEPDEKEKLIDYIYNFRIVPAGRHLWMAGVEKRQFLFNCYVSGWGDRLSEHFAFTFNQLMEGGGVGSNYSAKYVNPEKYPVHNLVKVELYCDPRHPNYPELMEAGLLTNDMFGAWMIPDSREGWVRALEKVIDASTSNLKMGDHYAAYYDEEAGQYLPIVRLDLSNIRPAGEPIKTFGGTSAGPVPLAKLLKKVATILSAAWELGGMNGPLAMDIDHEIATCVVSGNVRRSARMSIMHWNDPWIDWFLNCKQDGLNYWSTNISVEIDDEFIELINKSEDYGNIRIHKAKQVYRAIVEGMLRNGEPGIWNSSLSNSGEPNPVIATNPCGEIALEAWENCNLGHVNLSGFVRIDGSVDMDNLLEAHRLMTRFLIRATFGDISNAKTRGIVDRNRRIGVGHFGFAGYLAKQGIRFSESWQYSDINAMLLDAKAEVDIAAQDYAHQLRIPVPVKTTTVAPTGTIAKLPGATEGIHPVYARYFIRRVRYSMVDPAQHHRAMQLQLDGHKVEPDIYTPNTWVVEFPTKEKLLVELQEMGIDPDVLESVDEISLENLAEVQRMYQTYYADNAVSYTMNIPKDEYSVEEVMEILKPRLPYLKGTTIMVDESRKQTPYERIDKRRFYQETDWVDASVDDSYDENCASGACPIK